MTRTRSSIVCMGLVGICGFAIGVFATSLAQSRRHVAIAPMTLVQDVPPQMTADLATAIPSSSLPAPAMAGAIVFVATPSCFPTTTHHARRSSVQPKREHHCPRTLRNHGSADGSQPSRRKVREAIR